MQPRTNSTHDAYHYYRNPQNCQPVGFSSPDLVTKLAFDLRIEDNYCTCLENNWLLSVVNIYCSLSILTFVYVKRPIMPDIKRGTVFFIQFNQPVSGAFG
jgi:hypothetical protein